MENFCVISVRVIFMFSKFNFVKERLKVIKKKIFECIFRMSYKFNVKKKKNECVAFKMSFNIHLRLQQMMLLSWKESSFFCYFDFKCFIFD